MQTIPAGASMPFGERAPRNETNWIGLIRTFEGVEIPCTVKDVSKTGAKIGVPASYDLPESFMLKVVGKNFVCRVRLAWRRGHFAGLIIEQVGKIASKPVPTSEEARATDDTAYKAVGTRRSKVSTF
jgi:hypothetical protein